jgi:iron(III) transport system ATP-binding protein
MSGVANDLTIAGLVKSFGGVAAVDGLNLDVAAGECVAFLGPSGCGKSTTLRCVAGLETPDSGTIAVGGRPMWSPHHDVPPERRDMGMMFQSYALWPHLSVFDNVAFPLRSRRTPRAEITRRVREALGTVGLAARERDFPAQLSGGQQQRVALARSIVGRPRVLLFDEPLSNLDRALRDEMRIELRRLISELAITSIYVTHDQAEAFAVADRVVVMNVGHIEQAGPPSDIFARPRTWFVAEFLGAQDGMRGRIAHHGAGTVVRPAGSDATVPVETDLPAGTEVIVAVHPDRVRICPPEMAACGASLIMEVRDVLYLGAHVEVITASGAATVRARLRTVDVQDLFGSRGIVAGQQVLVQLDPVAARAYAVDTAPTTTPEPAPPPLATTS